jgi:hypothetical protein
VKLELSVCGGWLPLGVQTALVSSVAVFQQAWHGRRPHSFSRR